MITAPCSSMDWWIDDHIYVISENIIKKKSKINLHKQNSYWSYTNSENINEHFFWFSKIRFFHTKYTHRSLIKLNANAKHNTLLEATKSFFGTLPVARCLAVVSTLRSSSPRIALTAALFSSACLWIKATLFFIFSAYSAFCFSNCSW